MFHPYLSFDGSLITHSESPLIKINVCSKLEWIIDGGFHHSNEKDHEGNIWVPSWSFPIKTKGVNLDINDLESNDRGDYGVVHCVLPSVCNDSIARDMLSETDSISRAKFAMAKRVASPTSFFARLRTFSVSANALSS